MISAIFALAGTLIGVLGTVAVEMVRGRADDTRSRRDALRLACADFTADVARMKHLSIEFMRDPADKELMNAIREAHRDVRIHYERLRLITASQSAQEAGRYLVRYAYGLLRQAEGKPPREDEKEQDIYVPLNSSLMTLYTEIRREIGVPHPDDIYREPDNWIGPRPSDVSVA